MDAAHQFVLTPAGKAAPVTPVFTPVTLGEKHTQGDVKVIGPPTALTGVTLVDQGGTQAALDATFDRPSSNVKGFSFNYDFTGGGTDGAQLQIYLGKDLYFAMTGTVAEFDDLARQRRVLGHVRSVILTGNRQSADPNRPGPAQGQRRHVHDGDREPVPRVHAGRE